MIHFKDLTEEQFDDIGYFVNKLFTRQTGLDIDIWVTVKPFWDDVSIPYLLVFNDFDALEPNLDYTEISIEDEPRILSINNHSVSEQHFKQISDWIKLNKDALTKQWTMEYSTSEFNKNKKKLGDSK